MNDDFNAALLIIGNEILSGRTAEKNMFVLANLLTAHGWRLAEVRVVADITEEIAEAVNALRRRYAQVFTCGGIGPTHDDITSDSIAAAFGQEVVENQQAIDILTAFYEKRELELTPVRRRMARMPAAAVIIKSDFCGAPAYRVENVIVCAGVPAIFKLMASAAVARLAAGQKRQAQTLLVRAGESLFAEALEQVATRYETLEVGSYPREEDGKYVCQVVFTGSDDEARAAAVALFCDYLNRTQLPFELL